MPDNRMTELRRSLADDGAHLAVLAPGPHMDWLLGFHPHADERPCLLFVAAEFAAFLMPALNAEDVRARSDLPMYEWEDADGPDAALADLLAGIGGQPRRIVLDETMRADFALLAIRALDEPEVIFTDTTLGRLRMLKDDDEFRSLKENALIADRAMQAAREALRPGVTETEIAQAVRDSFAADGAQPLFTIVGSGGNGAYPHHQTGDRRLEQGDAVVIDIGARRGAFSSDITRMAAVGHPPEGYAEVHAVVERAVQAAMAAARPGAKARDVDMAARDIIAEAGYGEYFVHRTGHGMGLEPHEPPWITSSSDTVLETGMVFSIEPGIYIPGRFGIRLEDIVILREGGPETLSELPRDLYIREE